VKRYEITEEQLLYLHSLDQGYQLRVKEIPQDAVFFTRDQLELWVEDNVEHEFDGVRIKDGALDSMFNKEGGNVR
jgi:hypothetical protein